MLKILKLSPYYYPEQVASSHLSRDLDEALFIHDFVIENYVPTPCRGISKEEREKYKKIKYEERDDGHTIVHRFSMIREGRNPLQRALRYVLVNMMQYKQGSKAEGIDVVFSGSTPPTQGLLCAKVKKKLSKRYGRNVPFVYNLQDIFPDSLVNAKMTKENSIIWKIGRKIEDYTYKSADKIIVISEDYKRNIVRKGVPENKIIVIPNWVNTDNVIPIEREDNVLIDRYQIDPNSFILCYSGNIGHSQNLMLLIELAKRIEKQYSDIQIVIIGEGAQKEELKKQIKDNALSNVLLLPFQDYKEIAHVFSLGDVGLLISKAGVGLTSVPSKTWSIMAAGRPVLASLDKKSFASTLIEKVGCGLSVEANDIDALEASLIHFYNDRKMCKEMGIKGREYVKEELNKEIATKKYVDVIQQVCIREG